MPDIGLMHGDVPTEFLRSRDSRRLGDALRDPGEPDEDTPDEPGQDG
jgi:hypothetical protein